MFYPRVLAKIQQQQKKVKAKIVALEILLKSALMIYLEALNIQSFLEMYENQTNPMISTP